MSLGDIYENGIKDTSVHVCTGKNINYALDGVGIAEEELHLTEAIAGTNLSKRRDTGALVTSIVHTLCKLLGYVFRMILCSHSLRW